jgi:acetyltransferase
MSVDPTFGPMILFGAGGTAVEVLQDRALALPPLDILLARQVIAETRISRLLAGYRDRPPADLDALAAALVQTSELIIHHPEIRELDINPLLVDENGIIALDARMKIEDQALFPRRPLAIKPYPAEWEMRLDVAGLGPVDVRPVRPDDEERYRRFFALVSPDDIRLRFFTARAGFSHQLLARFTQIDYAREMAFVALSPGEQELMGVVRVALDPDLVRGEYGILIRSDLKGKGLGWRLMDLLITYARKERIAELSGLVLAENTTMLGMAREFGFEIRPVPGDATAREVVLDVSRATASPPPPRAAE